MKNKPNIGTIHHVVVKMVFKHLIYSMKLICMEIEVISNVKIS